MVEGKKHVCGNRLLIRDQLQNQLAYFLFTQIPPHGTFQDGMRTLYSMRSAVGGVLSPVPETNFLAKDRVMYSSGDKFLAESLIYMKFLPR